ncbi:MAG: EF-P lysine aminoacylase GenX [Bdellovibrionales bacterium]|nr:EF-P lysine aminoacylase GenX [Oligoflexia bacterium]
MNEQIWISRLKLEQKVREFFWHEGFLETRTPLLVCSPGMEPHLKPIELKTTSGTSVFLPTSPEFAMKKLLAKGLNKIFQIAPCFRDEPHSPDHSPEFTLLEFYESNITMDALQARVENLFQMLAIEFKGSALVNFRGNSINLAGKWPSLQVNELFRTHANVDLRTHLSPESLAAVCKSHGLMAEASESWDDLYFKLWLNLIEPKMPKNRPVFVTHYPLSQSSLCNPVLDNSGFAWANRFELYVGNFELANAFDELRDAKIQRKNFEHDQKIRFDVYGDAYPTSPVDEELLRAIEKMQPTCGIAIGLDRLAMLILEAENISEVLPLPSYW